MHGAVVKSFVCLRVVKSWTTTEFVFEKLTICQNSLSKLEIVLTIDGMYWGINCIFLYFVFSLLLHRVGFLRRFGLKTGIRSAHFGLESVKVFGGITGVYEGIYRFNSK